VTFEPLGNGQELRVTRRIYTDALNRPVTLQTVYRKTSATPDWNLYDPDRPARPRRPGSNLTAVVVPDGTVLTARLDQTINLRTAQEEDRVTLTVHNAPRPELEGATLEGFVVTTPSTVGQTSNVSMHFDQIRLRNGRSGAFDGVIEHVTGPDGRPLRFAGTEGVVDPASSNRAIQRGAIGAAIGGIIGAIAGGGRGALIGAAIGAGGAAATVLIDEGDRRELVRGTEFTIRAQTR
jgi:hypothetical protein